MSEFGACDGGTSIPLMKEVIGKIWSLANKHNHKNVVSNLLSSYKVINGNGFFVKIVNGSVWLPPLNAITYNDDVIIWKFLPHFLPYVRGMQLSPAGSPHKVVDFAHEGQLLGALVFPWLVAWTSSWTNCFLAVISESLSLLYTESLENFVGDTTTIPLMWWNYDIDHNCEMSRRVVSRVTHV